MSWWRRSRACTSSGRRNVPHLSRGALCENASAVGLLCTWPAVKLLWCTTCERLSFGLLVLSDEYVRIAWQAGKSMVWGLMTAVMVAHG